jgi:hypothetical protein
VRLRALTVYLWPLSVLVILAGFAWLTRHPDAEIVRRAQEWPGVGSLAARFRQAYLPPARPLPPARLAPPAAGAASDHLEAQVVPPDAEAVDARPYVWIEPGTPILAEPCPGAPLLETSRSLANLSLLERRGDWYRIRKLRPGERPLEGWVHLEGYREPSPEVLRQPEPVLPLPAAPPDPERIAAARELMRSGVVERRCGDHPLYSDIEDEGFLAVCGRLVEELEQTYTRRYGLEPVSPAREAILLFGREADYRRFRDREGVQYEGNLAHALPARGYVALYVGQRSKQAIQETLVHELAHLRNRRSLGPALPPWLREGIADDLAESRIDDDGSLHPGLLGGEMRSGGGEVVRRGGLAAVLILQEAVDADRLPRPIELVRFDDQEFYAAGRSQLHYAYSSFWVRYLLSDFDRGLAAGFRRFLRQVADGERLHEELLRARLERDWRALDTGFRAWLRLQYLMPTNELRNQRADSETPEQR